MAILVILWPTGARGVPNLGIWGVLGFRGLIPIFWTLGTLGTSLGWRLPTAAWSPEDLTVSSGIRCTWENSPTRGQHWE